MHNILETSPRVKPLHANPAIQNPQKWVKNSRSFTCLLNEIEEEERPGLKSKSPLHRPHP